MSGLDLAAGDKKKKPPMMAVSIGAADPSGDAPEEEDTGDDEEEALKTGGDAAIAALHAGDGLSFAKALVSIMSASGGEDDNISAADLDMNQSDEQALKGSGRPDASWPDSMPGGDPAKRHVPPPPPPHRSKYGIRL
jgi:hypothetical protein